MHATEYEPAARFDIESIQRGDGCSYIVTARGHGERQQKVSVDTKEEIAAVIAGMVDRWIQYCGELKDSDTGAAIVRSLGVIGADEADDLNHL